MRQNLDSFGRVLQRISLAALVGGACVKCGQPALEDTTNPAIDKPTTSASSATTGGHPAGVPVTASQGGNAPAVPNDTSAATGALATDATSTHGQACSPEQCPHGCVAGRCVDPCVGSTAPGCVTAASTSDDCAACTTDAVTSPTASAQPSNSSDEIATGELATREVTTEEADASDATFPEGETTEVPVIVCGDSLVQGDESCDDGNRWDNDGCSAVCAVERCGDNARQTNEQCDDGNSNDNDGCSSDCRTEACGDGVVQNNEGCDDGNRTGNDGCSADCKSESCGDGVRQGQEACDDGNKNNDDGCSSQCRNEECGDGVRQHDEVCDDGNTNNDDGCSRECRREECGDRVLQNNETCDDGNKNNNDGCSSSCKKETCGDKIVQTSESCDDGNASSNDGCSSQCKTEGCGDNVKQNNEECEDGNKNDNDGCNSQCKREFCGDNTKQNNEACDDGNTNPDDACNAKCQVNKHLQQYEGSCNAATGSVSRSQACVSAVRRYCSDMSGDLNLEAGVAQEIGAADNVFGVGCLDNVVEATVNFSELQSFDKGCGDPANAQKLDCLEAAHKYCDERHNREFGMIQAVSGNNATVVCDNVLDLITVPVESLTAKHSNCNIDRAATADCAAAARRLCRDLFDAPQGYEDVGGYVQTVLFEQVEADSYEFEVACLAFKIYDASAKVAIE